jgi:hypothetical protein
MEELLPLLTEEEKQEFLQLYLQLDNATVHNIYLTFVDLKIVKRWLQLRLQRLCCDNSFGVIVVGKPADDADDQIVIPINSNLSLPFNK